MSRISKYHESINKFIKEKCDLNENSSIQDEIKDFIVKEITSSNHYMSIITLTTLNNQSTKKHISKHGYYLAIVIEYAKLLINLKIEKDKYVEQLTDKQYYDIIVKLVLFINDTIGKNIEYVNSDKKITTSANLLKIVNEKITKITADFNLIDIEYHKTDFEKYNFKNNDVRDKLFANFKQIQKESLLELIETKYGSICQLAIILGWLFGGGDEKIVPKLEKLGLNLGILMKLQSDFESMDSEIESFDKKTHTTNYVINNGIQDSFELYINMKQKVIEDCMSLELYTNTITELLDIMDTTIDKTIDNTSLDLKTIHDQKTNK